ncbi:MULTISPECIES: hypothetical protein [Paenibacillus]|uniref:Uncharacterized protein n=1 Tax=Paenibacillus brasilensis TaxID=128574 RepID=A0ABU0KXF8_9BACL|nr:MULTISPECIES: hypothetical protein [Paenibacillus]MDQ0494135.1 hypothetical protein [Paenibacillus brasilensis]
MTFISDKTYWTIADRIYDRELTAKDSKSRVVPDWKIVLAEYG